MTRWPQRRAWLCVATALASQARVAGAETNTEDTLAETLYRQGRALMADGHYEQACTKFAESQHLDPASGTLLNLAGCHEAEHRYATAWLEYTEATGWARRDQRQDRVSYAEERIRDLDVKLSRLTVAVGTAANIAGLDVEVDGVSFRDAARSVPMPVDPGAHRVEARAPGRKPWSEVVSVSESPSTITVTVPVLEPIDVIPAVSAPAAAPEMRAAERVLMPVYVSGAVTIGAALGATATGIWFLSKKAQYNRSNDETDRRSAMTAGWMNAGFSLVTVLGAASTAYLYWVRPDWAKVGQVAPPKARAAWSVSPWIGARASGVVVEGAL